MVLEYLEGRLIGDTVASMAFLLETNDDNLMDVDTVWRTQLRGGGALGNHMVREDGFLVNGTNNTT